MRLQYLALLLALGVLPAAASTPAQDDGFVPMFNGKDLTGWVNVNCAPETFFVKDNMIITTGKPTGYLRHGEAVRELHRRIRLDARAARPKEVGNSGFFVWARSAPGRAAPATRAASRCRCWSISRKKDEYTSQGDLFSIWGAHCKPDRPHPKGWAHGPCPAKTAARAPTSGTTTASMATTASSSWPSTARTSPASASASRARATWPWSPKGRSAASRTSRSRNCPAPSHGAGNGRSRPPASTAYTRARPARLASQRRPKTALEAARLGPGLRRQVQTGGFQSLDRQGIRRH